MSGVPPDTELDDNTTLASATVVGAVTAVESAHPEAAQTARSAIPNICLFTTAIVASKTRRQCDTRMAKS